MINSFVWKCPENLTKNLRFKINSFVLVFFSPGGIQLYKLKTFQYEQVGSLVVFFWFVFQNCYVQGLRRKNPVFGFRLNLTPTRGAACTRTAVRPLAPGSWLWCDVPVGTPVIDTDWHIGHLSALFSMERLSSAAGARSAPQLPVINN